MAAQIKQREETILAQYLREMATTPLLTAEQEQELARQYQEGRSEVARQALMKANLRLVVSVAKRYAPSHDQDLLMDLIQEGNIGLMKAVERFMPGRETRFSTYGVYWIKQAILRALKSRRIVRLPENVVDRVLEIQRVKQKLYQWLGREPLAEEIGKEMNLPVREIRRLEEVSGDVVSLDQVVRGDVESDMTLLKDVLEDKEAPQPEREAKDNMMQDIVGRAVEALPERERKILEMRFGLSDNEPKTLEEIGDRFGISRERVRQLQNSALYRLRRRQAIQRAYR